MINIIKKSYLWILFSIWFCVLVVYPLMTYKVGVFRNVSQEVVYEPYIDNDTLVYKLRGEIYRSCPTSFSRTVVDSRGQVHQLVSSRIMGAYDKLGPTVIDMDVDLGPLLPAGETTYIVSEVPRCSWIQRIFPYPILYPPMTFTINKEESDEIQ